MIPLDYIALAIIAVLGVGGGLFLLFQAKKYRARADKCEKKEAMPKFETIDEVTGRLPPERKAAIEAEAEVISAAIESARLKREVTAKTQKKKTKNMRLASTRRSSLGLFKLHDDRTWVKTDGTGNMQKLNHIHSAFACFYLGNE